jgi:hypothetical protein
MYEYQIVAEYKKIISSFIVLLKSEIAKDGLTAVKDALYGELNDRLLGDNIYARMFKNFWVNVMNHADVAKQFSSVQELFDMCDNYAIGVCSSTGQSINVEDYVCKYEKEDEYGPSKKVFYCGMCNDSMCVKNCNNVRRDVIVMAIKYTVCLVLEKNDSVSTADEIFDKYYEMYGFRIHTIESLSH